MKKLLVFILVLAVAVGVLGYWRGWFHFSKEGPAGVQFDPAKFKQDKEAFSKAVGAKARAMKNRVAGLWKKSEGLTADDKAHAQKELGELKKKHDRLEQQIKQLDGADPDKFEGIKQDLSKNLEEVDKKIDELTEKLDTGKGK